MLNIMQAVVKIDNLSVVLGGRTKALNDVNLEISAGKITGVIGPSGAGKSTLMRCIVGRIQSGQSHVTVLNQPAGSPSLRKKMNYMAQGISIYTDLTVGENLSYFCALNGQSKNQAKDTTRRVLQEVGMLDKADSLVSELSGGQKQRASLAAALIGSPELMVLDEPTVGLDPVLRENLWKLFRRLINQGVTIIVTSHSMDEARRCDDLVLLREGRVIAHDSPASLCNKTKSKTVEESFLKLVGEHK